MIYYWICIVIEGDIIFEFFGLELGEEDFGIFFFFELGVFKV